MKIKMKTTSAGPAGVRIAGKVYEVPPDEAKDLLEGGYAVEADGNTPSTVERAIAKSDPETATGDGHQRSGTPPAPPRSKKKA